MDQSAPPCSRNLLLCQYAVLCDLHNRSCSALQGCGLAYNSDNSGLPAVLTQWPKATNTRLPEESKIVLKQWYDEHKDFPFPNKEQQKALAAQAYLTQAQVNRWFTQGIGVASTRIRSDQPTRYLLKEETGREQDSRLYQYH